MRLASRYGKPIKAKARRTISSTRTATSWSCTSAISSSAWRRAGRSPIKVWCFLARTNRRPGTRSPAKRSASRGKAEAALRVVSPEAALDAPCPGYRPADDGEPVARLSTARAGGILYNSCFKNVKFFPTLRVLSLDNCLYFFVYTIRMNMMPMEFEWDANKAISNLRKVRTSP